MAAANAFEFLVYGGVAAAAVGFVLWLLGRAIWDTGSGVTRSVFLGLIAVGMAVLVNDVRQRRLSLLSRLLVSLWVAAVGLLILAEVFSGMR